MPDTETLRERASALPTPVELERLEEAIPELEAAAAACEKLASELTAQAHGYRQIIAGFQAVRNKAAHTPGRAMPEEREGTIMRLKPLTHRGIAAVREVMKPGGVWTARQVHEELERRGWVSEDATHPRKATEAAMNRLWQRNQEIERVDRGEYHYKGSPRHRSAPATTGSAEP